MVNEKQSNGVPATSQSREEENASRVAGPAVSAEATSLHLAELVRRYRMCWEVWPEQAVIGSEIRQIGFRLELLGTHEDGVEHATPGCPACIPVIAALRVIAEYILPRESRPSIYGAEPYDYAFHYSPARMDRPDIVIAVTILHRGNLEDPVGECQRKCLSEMKQRLEALGVQNRSWSERDAIK